MAGTSPRKSSGPYPVHEEKYGVATGADGRCTSNIVSDLAFLDRRLSFARAEKLGEPLAHPSKAPARHVLYLPEAEGEVAFAADLAYKKYSQRQDQLRVLVSKAKTIISEKRERDFSQELKLVSNPSP